jgi:uncharacterized membrane-anchored protein YhcB (DUF1043 family)
VFQSGELLALMRGDMQGLYRHSAIAVTVLAANLTARSPPPGVTAATKKERDAALPPMPSEGQISKSGFIFGKAPA